MTGSRLSTLGLSATAFLVAVAYIPDIGGFAVAPRWAVLAAMVPMLLMVCEIEFWPGHWILCGVLGYAFLSLAWSPIWPDAFDEWCKLLILGGAFCLGAAASDLTVVHRAFAVGVGMSVLIAVAQRMGYDGIEQIHGPAGLFGNRNFFGEACALGTIAMLASRRFGMASILLLGVALSLCRGAVLGLWLGGVVLVWPYWRGLAIVLLGLLPIGLVGLVIYDPHGFTLIQRLAMWNDTIDALTWFGHGIGSFAGQLPAISPRLAGLGVRTEHAHNDFLEALFEYGAAAYALVGLVVVALCAPAVRERAVLACFLGCGLVGFPLHQPATAFIGALVAGHLCGAGAGLRRNVADSGIRRGAGYAAGWPESYRA